MKSTKPTSLDCSLDYKVSIGPYLIHYIPKNETALVDFREKIHAFGYLVQPGYLVILTGTSERHVSMLGSGTGNLNVWTIGGLGGGYVVSALVRIGRRMLPMTPLWSKNEVVRLVVPPTWAARCPGSQIVR